MRDYTALIEAGTAAQLEKLEQNGHKEGFDNININYALKRITEEYVEAYQETHESIIDYSKVRHEAADIANFAHMVILACDKQIKPS